MDSVVLEENIRSHHIQHSRVVNASSITIHGDITVSRTGAVGLGRMPGRSNVDLICRL